MPSIVLPQPSSPEARLLQRIAALEERIQKLERGPAVPVKSSAPDAAEGREGSVAASTAPRMWVKINGTWRYATLT